MNSKSFVWGESLERTASDVEGEMKGEGRFTREEELKFGLWVIF